MSQRLEIWSVPKKWKKMNENVKKKRKKGQDGRRMKKNEKHENKKLN